mmetsp:Transcript_17487/g.27948  ORF Transcript_17487/g.27948 Transcript_17487/m.27948 type:complete len:285 (+) Transcript_17487:197-1051(+)
MRNPPVFASFVLFLLSNVTMTSESRSFQRYRVGILRLRAGANERTMSPEPASRSSISSNATATIDIAQLIRERDEALNRERLALEKVEQATKVVADFAKSQATQKRAYQTQYDEDRRERGRRKESGATGSIRTVLRSAANGDADYVLQNQHGDHSNAENHIPTKDGVNVTTSGSSISDINQEKEDKWDDTLRRRSPRGNQEANKNDSDEDITDENVSNDPNDSFDDDDSDSSLHMPDDHPDNCKPRTDPLVRAESIRDAMSMTLDQYIEKRRRRGDPYYAYEPR